MTLDEAAAVSGYKRVTEYIEELSKYGISETDCLRADNLIIGGIEAVGYFYFDGGKLVQAHYRLQRVKATDTKTIDPTVISSYANVTTALDAKYAAFKNDQASHRFKHTTPQTYNIDLSSSSLDYLVSGSNYKASYIIPQTDGGMVYIDHYVTAEMKVINKGNIVSELSFSDEHLLDYTYYAFQLDPNEPNTNEVDF